jgi:DNA-3-methyladenine glycosylase I
VVHRDPLYLAYHDKEWGRRVAESLAAYVWSFEPDRRSRPKKLDWPTLTGMGTSKEATAMSKDLKRRGWTFVGPTTLYSVMQSVGLVNDHMSACDVGAGVEKDRSRFRRPGRLSAVAQGWDGAGGAPSSSNARSST